MIAPIDHVTLVIGATAVVSLLGILLLVLPPGVSDAFGRRVKAIGGPDQAITELKPSTIQRTGKDGRRKLVQDTLNQMDERNRIRRWPLAMRTLLVHSGISLTVARYWLVSGALGVLAVVLLFTVRVHWTICLAGGLAMGTVVPRWFLKLRVRKRQERFLDDFADAIDVIVRGLKSGLPVADAMKLVSTEFGAPVGPEFLMVVEGQRVGLTLEQGVRRMHERLPLQEVGFLSILMSIQAKTGGNLSEALSNLSKILRERRKMKAKIRARSQEARTSAAIIGSVPFLLAFGLSLANPGYLEPLFTTVLGKMLLLGVLAWMLVGVLVMRRMVDLEV